METNSEGGVMVKNRHIVVFCSVASVALLVWAVHSRFSKLESDIAFMNRANIIQTQVINKQGKAVSALIEHAGLDEDEILKGE